MRRRKKAVRQPGVTVCPCSGCCRDCENCDLRGLRVLLVGGITRIQDRYRAVIEERQGIFEYHDGYVRKGTDALGEQIRRSDVVICPVTCNSHGACMAAKAFGKKFNKPIFMLPRASCSALSQAMNHIGSLMAEGMGN